MLCRKQESDKEMVQGEKNMRLKKKECACVSEREENPANPTQTKTPRYVILMLHIRYVESGTPTRIPNPS